MSESSSYMDTRHCRELQRLSSRGVTLCTRSGMSVNKGNIELRPRGGKKQINNKDCALISRNKTA